MEHCYMGLTNRASYEMLACFIYVWRWLLAYSDSGASELGSVQVCCGAKGRPIPLESSRTGWYHRYKLIRTSKPREMQEAITMDDTLCFCLFEFGESRRKWMQVLATSVLCASIECAQMACNWHYFNFKKKKTKPFFLDIYISHLLYWLVTCHN